MENSSWKRSEHECPGPLKVMENNFVLESVGPTQKSAHIIRYDWDRRKMEKHEWRK